ncbi:MAG: oxidoreductase, partial [Candidatus Omnitrophota bacterium]
SKREDILNRAYKEVPTVKNPQQTLPQVETEDSGHKLDLSGFHDSVKALDQVIEVDYYIPGCPPTPDLIKNAVMAILEGKLPEKGSVLAEKKALCDSCSRKDSKPEKTKITEFKRVYEIEWDAKSVSWIRGLFAWGRQPEAGAAKDA